MKRGHAMNDWIREIHDDVNGAACGNVDGIQPRWIRDPDTVFLDPQPEINLLISSAPGEWDRRPS